MYPTKSDYFTLDNGELLFFEEYDPVSPGVVDGGFTLVALHGLGGGGYFFSGLGRSIGFGGRVICPDMPGSGFSERGKHPVSFDRFADVIVQLIGRKTKGPVALMGHSMGTIVALKIYSSIPSRICSMVFVGGLPAPLPEARNRLRDRASVARSMGMAAVAPTLVPIVFSRRSFDSIPDKATMFHRLLALNDPEGYAQTALALADASAAEVVPNVRVPCLCITGTEDRYAPPSAVRDFAVSIPGTGYHELPDCAHMPFFEAPEAFSVIVEQFLSKARRVASAG
jgi:3-oxoadipate enol-lactonase